MLITIIIIIDRPVIGIKISKQSRYYTYVRISNNSSLL